MTRRILASRSIRPVASGRRRVGRLLIARRDFHAKLSETLLRCRIGEGGDDIFVGSAGPDKLKGMSGFDWATYKDMDFGVSIDFFANALNETPVPLSVASTTSPRTASSAPARSP